MRRHLALAFVVTLAGLTAGYALVRSDIGYFNVLVPESVAGNRGPAWMDFSASTNSAGAVRILAPDSR